MKKKVVVFAILILAAVLFSVYLVRRPKSLGNMVYEPDKGVRNILRF